MSQNYELKTTITYLPTGTTVLLTLLSNEAKDIIIFCKQTMLWTYMSQNYDKGGCHMRFFRVLLASEIGLDLKNILYCFYFVFEGLPNFIHPYLVHEAFHTKNIADTWNHL